MGIQWFMRNKVNTFLSEFLFLSRTLCSSSGFWLVEYIQLESTIIYVNTISGEWTDWEAKGERERERDER